MSCLWKLFSKKQPERPKVLTDSKVKNPLNLDMIYDDLVTLQAMESALISNLVSIHYNLEETKKRVAIEFQKGHSQAAKDALAKRVMLAERKKLFETRLQRVQTKLKEIKSPK